MANGEKHTTQRGNVLLGKPVAEKIRSKLRRDVAEVRALVASDFRPSLCVVQVGDRPDSTLYIKMKRQFAESVGVGFEVRQFPESVCQAELVDVVSDINADPGIDGAIIQLPLPAHLDSYDVYDRLSPTKDVDGFHSSNLTFLARSKDFRSTCFVPCTALAVYRLLSELDVDPVGLHAVVIGRSNIAGLPTAYMLRKLHCTTSILHSLTRDVRSHVSSADIVVSAVGSPHLIPGDWIKPGAIVIDIGISVLEDASSQLHDPRQEEEQQQQQKKKKKKKRVTGDVEFETAVELASAITPVPGGVGPVTVACLIENTVLAAKRHLLATLEDSGDQDKVDLLQPTIPRFAFHAMKSPK
jgi:methylenetetrahydrofolate dehydrogenase (NADP+)/methenyltetrahydrofolate cyclohydrolase/formyltetrahydrofolate synthetase